MSTRPPEPPGADGPPGPGDLADLAGLAGLLEMTGDEAVLPAGSRLATKISTAQSSNSPALA